MYDSLCVLCMRHEECEETRPGKCVAERWGRVSEEGPRRGFHNAMSSASRRPELEIRLRRRHLNKNRQTGFIVWGDACDEWNEWKIHTLAPIARTTARCLLLYVELRPWRSPGTFTAEPSLLVTPLSSGLRSFIQPDRDKSTCRRSVADTPARPRPPALLSLGNIGLRYTNAKFGCHFVRTVVSDRNFYYNSWVDFTAH